MPVLRLDAGGPLQRNGSDMFTPVIRVFWFRGLVRGSLWVAALVLAFPLLGHAQATRTWVSGVGDDANPCSRTAPCKTWAGAISKTAAGGEIDALDPAGFGALTITKAITLDGGGGQVASVLVAGTNGIVVAAGVNDAVILRNLRFNGLAGTGSPGLSGILFTSGASLRIQNVQVDRFGSNGISISVSSGAPLVEILDTTVSNSGNGLAVNVTGGTATVSVERSRFIMSLTTCNPVTPCGNGVLAAGSGASVQLSNSVVFGNPVGINPSGGGVINSFGNNQVQGNTSNGSFSGTVSNN